MDCIKLKQDSSLARVFNASSCEIQIDVFIDGKLVFDNIDFRELSKYVKLKKGSYKLDVYESGSSTNPLIRQKVEVDGKELYTIAIIGDNEDLSLLVINDYASKCISDEYSSFRLINLSTNSDEIDIVVDGDTLFKDIAYREGTVYADVKIDEYNIKILSSIDMNTLLKAKLKFKADRIYTIYILGSDNNLSLIQSVDGNTYLCR